MVEKWKGELGSQRISASSSILWFDYALTNTSERYIVKSAETSQQEMLSAKSTCLVRSIEPPFRVR